MKNVKNYFVLVLLLVTITVFYKFNKIEKTEDLDPIKETEPVTPEIPPPQISRIAKNYTEAIQLAKQQNITIFIYFGAPWCTYCEQMKNTTLQDLEVKKELNNYIYLIINTDEDKKVARKFSVRGIPAYIVIDTDENVLKRSNGYKTADEFLSWLNS